MIRLYVCVIFLVLLFTPKYGQSQDTTITTVGPGHTRIHIYDPAALLNINILRIDLTNSENTLTSVLANDVLGEGFERTTSMAGRSGDRERIVIGGINADFFGIREPENPFTFLSSMMVREREIVSSRTRNRPFFGITGNNSPIVDILDFSGNLIISGESYPIDGVNRKRDENTLILYNRYIGTSTPTDSTGFEFRIKPLDEYAINDTMRWKITAIEDGIGNMIMYPHEYVLSAHGDACDYLKPRIQAGDTVSIVLEIMPGNQDIFSLVGGGSWLVHNGEIIPSEGGDLHPRTAVGISQDSSMVYMVTVDGRIEDFSIGMTLAGLAGIMKSAGCYHAINLDGGGSTTMVIRDEMVNYQLLGERLVANALLSVSNIFVEDIVEHVAIYPQDFTIDITQTQQLELEAIDQWGYTLSIHPDEIEWSFKNISGYINDEWEFVPGDTGIGEIIGTMGPVSDTISVSIRNEPVRVDEIIHNVVDSHQLYQNYPNPFNPITTISYSLAEQSYVTLTVYNILGIPIATIVNAPHVAGIHTVSFDASDIPSGIYFYTLRANGFTNTKRMVVSK